MQPSAREAFAARLVEAMLDAGYKSARNAKSGVDVGPLRERAKVTREMARRYTEGSAVPDINKMKLIAEWLGVRLAWLRDGEGPKHTSEAMRATEPVAKSYLPEEAEEIAQMWLKLPPDRREWFRDLMALEAIVAHHYPWLTFGRPRRESYNQYERRIEHDILRIANRLQKVGK